MARRWTDAERRRLVLLHGTMTQAQIGTVLGRSEDAIRTEVWLLRTSGRLGGKGIAKGRGRTWTSQDDDRLVALYRAGRPRAEIARAVGRSANAVQHRARALAGQGRIQLRMSGPAHVNWDDGLFRRLWACERITLTEIAAHYGVTRSAVTYAGRVRGLPARADRYATRRTVDPTTVRRLWKLDISAADIARACGCTPKHINNLRRKLGLPPRERGRGGHAGWGSVPAERAFETIVGERMRAAA